jgi:spore maturation protein CgeB
MKILLVGSDFKHGIEQYFIKYLSEAGCEIIHYPAQDIALRKRSGNLARKILFKTQIFRGYVKINKELMELCKKNQPDIIWIFKGMEIYPESLKQLRNHFKLVNYNPDHPFIIAGSGSGNKNVTRAVPLYHLHFCYNRNLQQYIESRYHIPTVFLPFGYELAAEDYERVSQLPEINEVCFIGNPDKIRVEVIRLLAANGFRVSVYGHGWNKTTLNRLPNVLVHDAVYGLEFWSKLRQYRVQLNIFRKHNIGSHNMRSFEIPAIGGIQLSPYSEEQDSFFSEGKEVFFYRDAAELLVRAKELLMMSSEDSNKCRGSARKRSLESSYSYKDRAHTVHETFIKLIG